MQETINITKDRINNEEISKILLDKWYDWKWQLKNSIHKVETVEKILGVTFSDKKKQAIKTTIEKFPMSVTPYYLSLVDTDDPENDPVFKQCFPDIRELSLSNCDMSDPLHEDKDSPVEGITHRYPDRVLFHISNVCAMYCRHCTRKRKVGDVDSIPSKEVILKGIEYLKNTPQVRDVLISGGDPLMLSDDYLDWILSQLSEIPHVEVIRIGSRMPVVLPYRITDELVEVLKKYDNIWLNTHFNHPREITGSSRRALKKLSGAGIPLGNQSVLLRDVNDCPRIMKRLVHKLTANKVRPYYLYQCDLSEGLEHFRTNVGKGIEIMENLRGHTSGFAVPTYVIDAPGGGGKIPVMPSYLISWSTNKVILRNYEGVITTYKMPDDYKHNECDLECENCNLTLKTENDDLEYKTIGISKLLSDYEEEITLTPENLERDTRNSGDAS
ncbi:lysine 2,3-aminomutase [Alkalibacter saccharofermentans]|uniref:L-lysine 2,3-aminomutase n=1 Tax=Alkalibacter saccharofermentans DSM 14828 TaxID=1120975 RepID=A0A1M4WIW5_9FIRM|nr:lysine 2,3-aminomutase [Alkalibacter saccharofermentans]SHE81166.1 L-lysine 2,3-aminomutase [Alkalibacter saccharofermentans DSM 14828]